MKFQNLFPMCLLLIFAAACAPAPSESTLARSTDSAESSDTTRDGEDDHADGEVDHGSGEGEQSDDADEIEHDGEDEKEHREFGAHEHGVAELMIAWFGNEMAIDLQTPAYNVLGFEYVPTTEEEKALATESVAALEAGNLLRPNSDVECTLVSASVQSDLVEEAHDDEAHDDEEHGDNEAADDDEDHSDEDHGDEAHSEFDVSYNLECQQSDKIESLDASALFERFPNFEDIEVQWVSDTQQSATEITPENPVVSLN